MNVLGIKIKLQTHEHVHSYFLVKSTKASHRCVVFSAQEVVNIFSNQAMNVNKMLSSSSKVIVNSVLISKRLFKMHAEVANVLY